MKMLIDLEQKICVGWYHASGAACAKDRQYICGSCNFGYQLDVERRTCSNTNAHGLVMKNTFS